VAEFVLVSALVLVLFLGLIQLAVFLHVRNLANDAASNGARIGALVDASAADGAARADELLRASLGGTVVDRVSAEERPGTSGDVVTVTVRVRVPLLGLLRGPTGYTATAHATRFS